MDEHQPYDPGVYKRLELVRKQFQRQTTDQKAQQAAEKRMMIADWLKDHKHEIVRWAVYVLLGVLVLAVIGIVILTA